MDAQDRVDCLCGSIRQELLGGALAADRLVRVQAEEAEERALFRTTEREHLRAPDDFKRPEDAELEIRMPRRRSMVRPSFCEWELLASVCSMYSSRLAAVFSGA